MLKNQTEMLLTALSDRLWINLIRLTISTNHIRLAIPHPMSRSQKLTLVHSSSSFTPRIVTMFGCLFGPKGAGPR
jgi:hypothetical protein